MSRYRDSYQYGRDRESPTDRGDDGRYDHDKHSDEDDDEVKPYTAVGAALDSAARFKRRMNYGRLKPKREDKTPEENKSPQEMPRYMKPTEAYSRRASTTRPKSPEHWADDPELRKKYPHWYKDQDNNNESDNRRSPDSYGERRSSPDDRRSPERNDSGRYDTNSPTKRRSPESGSPTKYKSKYSSRFSPSRYGRQSPEPYDRYEDERRDQYNEEQDRVGDLRSSDDDKKTYEYGRSSSAESFQTVRIKKSDLDEIKRRYELQLKEKPSIQSSKARKVEEDDDKANIYKYSSHMRNTSNSDSQSSSADRKSADYRQPRSRSADSGGGGGGDRNMDSWGRSKTQSRDKKQTRKKREDWKNYSSVSSDIPDSRDGNSKLTPHQRYARRKSYDASRSRSSSPMPNLSNVRSSGYGSTTGPSNDRSVSRDQSYNARRETDSRGRRSFQLLPSVDT